MVKFAATAAIALMSFGTQAQVIKMRAEPYIPPTSSSVATSQDKNLEKTQRNVVTNLVLPSDASTEPTTENNTSLKTASFLLKKNKPLHEQLMSWAADSGWELVWKSEISWRVVRDTDYFNRHQNVTDAMQELMEVVREEGRPIRLNIAEGNRFMEIYSTEVRHD